MYQTMLASLALLLVITGTARADEPEIAPEEVREKALERKEKQGWEGKLNLGATFSFTHSQSVVGQPDGVNLVFGLVLSGGLAYYAGQHAWENELKIQETFTKTPLIDKVVKSADELDLVSLYTFRLKDPSWFGVYARFRLNTAIFEGYEVRPADTVYRKQMLEGPPVDEAVPAQQALDLTGPFETLRLVESAGAFANPIEEEKVTIKTKLGLGAQQIIARDGFAVADDDATADVVEVKQLDTSNQVGGELELEGLGKLDKTVSWTAKAYFFYPFVSSDDTYSGIDALQMEFSAGLSVRLAEWASLDYVFSAKRIPLILDDWQIQNGLVLTAGFTVP